MLYDCNEQALLVLMEKRNKVPLNRCLTVLLWVKRSSLLHSGMNNMGCHDLSE